MLKEVLQLKRNIHNSVQFISVIQLCLTLRSHALQHTRLPCPSLTPGACSNSCPFSRRCHPAISSSVVPFSSCPQSLPASGSFPVSQLSASGGRGRGRHVGAEQSAGWHVTAEGGDSAVAGRSKA